MILRLSVLSVLAGLLTNSAHAQRLTSDFPTLHATPRTVPQLAPTPPRTYWLEGGLIGGIGLGLLSGYEMNKFCETGDNCTTSTIGVRLLGAGLGLTVGPL